MTEIVQKRSKAPMNQSNFATSSTQKINGLNPFSDVYWIDLRNRLNMLHPLFFSLSLSGIPV